MIHKQRFPLNWLRMVSKKEEKLIRSSSLDKIELIKHLLISNQSVRYEKTKLNLIETQEEI